MALFLRIFIYAANGQIFALKGGKAINVSYCDLSRLSVNVNLNSLPVKDPPESCLSLAEITDAVDRTTPCNRERQ